MNSLFDETLVMPRSNSSSEIGSDNHGQLMENSKLASVIEMIADWISNKDDYQDTFVPERNTSSSTISSCHSNSKKDGIIDSIGGFFRKLSVSVLGDDEAWDDKRNPESNYAFLNLDKDRKVSNRDEAYTAIVVHAFVSPIAVSRPWRNIVGSNIYYLCYSILGLLNSNILWMKAILVEGFY